MTPDRTALPFSRLWIVVLGALAMGVAGTYQFVWSSIRGPLGAAVGASHATLGTLFTLLIAAQTLSQFPAGWFRDRYGPRVPLFVGAVLIAGGYAGLAIASAPAFAAASVVVGGAGAGTAYTVAVNTPVKWFDERRGLATGVVTMTYAGLSVVLIPVVRGGLAGTFRTTMFVFAAIGAVVCVAGALVLRDPERLAESATDATAVDADDESDETAVAAEAAESDSPSDERTVRAYSWREAVRTWQFWVLYAVFVVVNGVGLMLIGSAIAFADGLGLSAAVATAAASTVALGDGAGVIAGGAASDRYGPVRTAGAALLLSAAGIVVAVFAGAQSLAPLFLVGVALAAFFRSPVFAIFPGLVGEYYGTARSSENYAVLYTGKLWGSVFGGAVASALVATVGWSRSFLLGAGLLALAGMATFAVRPVAGDARSDSAVAADQ